MNKKKNEDLIKKADEALNDRIKDSEGKFIAGKVNILNKSEYSIKDSYNGQTAALGVTIAMSGLLPALAIYQKKTDDCDKIQILNAIALMMDVEMRIKSAEKPGEALFRDLLKCNNSEQLKKYKKEIIDCSIALKQVIRTYKLVKS